MQVSINQRWEAFVEGAVATGQYGSAGEVVEEALKLLHERDRRIGALRATLHASIAAGGEVTEDQLDQALQARAEALRAAGVGS